MEYCCHVCDAPSCYLDMLPKQKNRYVKIVDLSLAALFPYKLNSHFKASWSYKKKKKMKNI